MVVCNHKYIENGVMEYKCLLCGYTIRSHFAIECLLGDFPPLNISEWSKTQLLREYLNLGQFTHTSGS